jgi:peroxiredoxin
LPNKVLPNKEFTETQGCLIMKYCEHKAPCRRIFLSLVTALSIAVCLTQADSIPAAEELVTQSSFAGSLIQPGSGDGEILRRFEVRLFSRNGLHFFHVMDDVRSGCPWPDSFGETGPAATADKVQPHLLYSYDGTFYQIGIPPLVVALPADVQPDVSWEQHGWQMTAIESRTAGDQTIWTVEARERRGRQQQLTVEASTGFVVRAESDVFMGQGDQFLLSVARSATETLDEVQSVRMTELQGELIKLQSTLQRRPDAIQSELSKRQVQDSAASIESLKTLSEKGPLQDLIRRIGTDIEQQTRRLASASARAEALVNSPSPDFTLKLVGGGTVDSASLRGKTVVLHFWDYRDSPLSEPYGQTGYLEFLFNQKKSKNVHVIGISTNPELQSTDTLNRGRRSARKLSEFMNLTYPIGHDDGSLLESFGDPRDARGQLPLWIVLSPEGKVTHYHAGFYEIDAAQGLKELESVLSSQTPAAE